MKAIVSVLGFAMLLGCAGGAHAQATRTWVSGVGDDANPCSRTAPCKTFAGAISKTAAAGEINCIDPGGFGSVTITKSLAIVCDQVEAGIASPGTNGINVNAGASDVVFIRGLDIQGYGTGLTGINFIAGAALHVSKSTIRGFGTNNGSGIRIAPASGTSSLFISDTTITDNPSAATPGAGISVQATGSGSVYLDVRDSSLINGGAGIRVDGTLSSGSTRAIVRRTEVAGNARAGISANSNGPVVRILADDTSTGANLVGVNADGPGAVVALTRTVVTANGTGLQASNGGIIQSYGDNEIDNNTTTDGPAPTGIAHR